MGKRIILKNLQVADFIHNRELELQKSVINSPEVKKLIELVSDVNLRLNKTKIQGTYIQLTEQTAPNVLAVLADVCRILDHAQVPEVYMTKMASLTMVPCTAETDYIVVSDYVLEHYDEEMLYFSFGNAIAMIKVGHVKMTTAAAYMGCNIRTALPQIKFKEYLLAADATSDRGGLLACQSLAAAARVHFFELGLPPAITRELFATDEEAAQYIERYLAAVAEKNDTDRKLTQLGEWWMDLNYTEAAANNMLLDLYVWYRKHYNAVLAKYGTEVSQ